MAGKWWNSQPSKDISACFLLQGRGERTWEPKGHDESVILVDVIKISYMQCGSVLAVFCIINMHYFKLEEYELKVSGLTSLENSLVRVSHVTIPVM